MTRSGSRGGGVDVVVVGAGPNGLAAALVLAGAGLQVEMYEANATVGGGARTQELTLPGFHHDVCSAVHPMALASPFFRAFDLPTRGVHLRQPEVAYAHPLDGGRAGIAWRDLDRTVAGLGADGRAWRSLLGPLAEHWSELAGTALSDMRRPPAHPGTAVRLALRVLDQAAPWWRARFAGDVAPAMLTGVNAHAIAPARGVAATAVGLVLAALAHAVGWPIPEGGSQRISDALANELRRRGGRIHIDHRVECLAELPPARAVLLDVAPANLLRLAAGRLPARYARALRAFRRGGAACKVDFALAGPVPWAAPECAQAGTLHLVGSSTEAVAAEAAVVAGRHADRPYVLAVQPGVVDPGRAPAGRHVLWTYAHVPNGSTRDVREQVTAQVERFAPGFRDLILAEHVIRADRQEAYNPNNLGGDISGGATTVRQMVARPVARWDPYRTPLPGVYLCSASTPPGQAVHGMCGVHAARRALRDRFGIRTDPLALVAGTPAG
ncbi:NAD(P)/FAD-dependent oxidoreductase [Micromonospora lupini]|uniref:phytoene desaturase family protein n=1 Tax=Micromonospora lupini TaxID=285679 RepID=UPI00225C3B74|nr:NAD(P)/FAD-dependent oxidoreductase [Micromonospora lupini]MCX5069006.1 NAD(P)/FAD-dependent oxidoreductase [Micromonospora lupini]